MRFCPECENLLYPVYKKEGKKNGNYLICKFCGYEEKVSAKEPDTEDYKIEEKIAPKEDVMIMEEDEPRPKITIECPRCSNNKAFHWERYNDDGEIILLYKCTKCKHVWAEQD